MKANDPLGLKILKLSIIKGTVVDDSWRGFIKIVYPELKENTTQWQEMRKAYFGGFYSNFDLMGIVSMNWSEDEAAEILDKIKEECENEIRKIAKFKSIG